eukprot:Plantae.Rhodophyta-Rhodochaete_pulchella.ctg8277.p2 GENE.Plantae.Rhodophyta-Rhodochaete_pulchella.ctg8277~~Plantae.Rhodophyta-Rhodochaete_pulchella.ctg8277.p2  ORF type:complete len:175 (+),score=21.26 Plantae.Rhodophyta-Rhodochaete_pulchella.ctg8277:80-604(+)
MARAGRWELKEVLLRYSLNAGSSRGVRDFVNEGLVLFARDNPQLVVRTQLRESHPFVDGRYINGYRRVISLKNLDRADVREVFMYMRNTLGHRVPDMNEVTVGVVESKRPTIQGHWRTPPSLYNPNNVPANSIENTSRPDLDHVIERLGLLGTARLLSKLTKDYGGEHRQANTN